MEHNVSRLTRRAWGECYLFFPPRIAVGNDINAQPCHRE